jgi:hypothetical protein
VLPIFLEFVGDGQPEADGRLTSRSWSRRRFFDSHHGVADGLRSGLEEALGSIARDDPVAFGAARQQLIAARAVVADDLLARAYTASPEPYAADVLAWIRDNPRRLGIGYVDSPYWRGRELVAAIWPFLDEDGRSGLEEVLTTFYPDHERTKEGRRYRGDAQFTLLDGLPSTGLSISAKTRLGELQRKFGAATPPHRTSAGFVESPIPASAIKHMSDSQWIEAMRQYGSDDMRARGESGMVGGLFQVSAQLRDATTRDPSRFISLAEQLPGEVSPEYLDAILRGASSAEDVPVEQMLGLVRLAHAVPNRPYGQPICDAVAKHADPGDLPPDIVEAIAWYATDGPESEPEREPIDDDHQDARTHLLSQGMGTDRGRAALAIARLIYRGSPLAYWRGTIERLVDEQSQPVLACVAETLLASLRHDRPWVAGLVPAVMAGMPEVASSVYAESLLKHLTPTHPNTTLPVIAELERSSAPAVSRVGGRLAALAVLAQVETRSMDHLATCASPGGRLGVAEVCAANISDPALSDACRAGLLELMSDSEEEVRREVGTAFRTLIDKPLGGERGLIDAFLASPAFPESPDSLLDALLAAPELLSPQNLVACNGLIDVVASDGSKPWRSFSVMPDVAALAIRTYVHGGADTRSGALDVVDRLSVLGVYGYESALAEFER